MTITLNGGQASSGQATNNTLTDVYQVIGADNLILTPGGGNLTVNGINDTATTILLGGVGSPAANQSGDKITINLDGSDNTIEPLGFVAPYPYQLNDATVNITVSGTGGFNTVALDNNGGGISNVTLGGPDNLVELNGDATNSVTLTGGPVAGHNTVQVGYPFNSDFGFSSTIVLSGSDNLVQGGDENFNISGGVRANTVQLGNGNSSITLSFAGIPGGFNLVEVGDGNNNIHVLGNKNTVDVGSGSNLIAAKGNHETINIFSGDKLLGAPGNDTVIIHGMHDTVTETNFGFSAAANVAISASTGNLTASLSDGNDTVIAGGNDNKITAGKGVDNVTANGNFNTITLGAGSDTVSDTGMNSVITLNGGPGSQDSTTLGSNDTLTATNGVQVVTALGGDNTINLTDTNVGTAITFDGQGNMAFISGNGSFEADYVSSVPAGPPLNDVTINGDGSGDYTGTAVLDGLIPGNGQLDFNGVDGTGAFSGPLGGSTSLLDFLTHPIAGGYQITTQGGGTVTIHTTQGLSSSMFS